MALEMKSSILNVILLSYRGIHTREEYEGTELIISSKESLKITAVKCGLNQNMVMGRRFILLSRINLKNIIWI